MRVRFKLFGLSIEPTSNLGSALAVVAKIMASAKDPWWIIGSAAVALHLQRDIGVNDVDILLSVTDARHIREELAIARNVISPHPIFHSEEYFTSEGHALPIEFMAGFSVCVDGEWSKVTCNTRQAFSVMRQRVYTPELQELLSLLESFGRTKDIERIKLLGDATFSV